MAESTTPDQGKHTPKSPTTVLDVPEDFLSHVREGASKELFDVSGGRDQFFDLRNNIQENIQAIRGLLVVNKEIWDRCKASFKSQKDGNFLEFQTFGYATVKVRDCNDGIQFVTSPKRFTKSFDMKPLMSIPETISSTKSFQLVQPGSIEAADGLSCSLIDFETYFENSLLLHDQVLQPFLETLKSHIGDIQVCLGAIEEWFREIEDTQSFIETTFTTTFLSTTFTQKLDVPQKKSDLLVDNPFPSRHDRCRKCKNTYVEHDGFGYCPGNSSYDNREVGDFRKVKEFILMKKKFDGKLEYSFVVNCEEGQESLKKLLDFLESC